MANIIGNAQGVDDTLIGSRGADTIQGLSGDDLIFGGRGDDLIIGGQGSDVMWGGLDADTFEFSSGHIGAGLKDYIGDFNVGQDLLSFRSSAGGQTFVIESVTLAYLTETSFNGNDLVNNVATGTDVIFTVSNALTGATQEIILLDAWSGLKSAAWDAYLDTLQSGLTFT